MCTYQESMDVMSEQTEHKEALIPRETPVINVKIGERAVGLTYDNTFLYTFGHGYKAMDHIYVKDETVEPPIGTYIWREQHPELFERLFLAEFQSLKAPYPQDVDIESYEEMQARNLDGELESLGEQE